MKSDAEKDATAMSYSVMLNDAGTPEHFLICIDDGHVSCAGHVKDWPAMLEALRRLSDEADKNARFSGPNGRGQS